MINNINNNQAAYIMGKTPLPHPDSANTQASKGSDVALQVNFADLINQAKHAENADSNAVDEARELLRSGRLTRIENIRSAAENIITNGL